MAGSSFSARVAKSVDARDLKSLGTNPMRVRSPPRASINPRLAQRTVMSECKRRVLPVLCVPGESGNAGSQKSLLIHERSDGDETHAEKNWACATDREIPASRRAARIRRKALKAFAEAGVDCEVMSTEAPGHAATIAKTHAHKYDAVFTLGGDGTVMEVLGALGHQGPPVGVLAGGTANVVARTFRIPLNPARAVPMLLNGDEARNGSRTTWGRPPLRHWRRRRP